MIRASRRGVLSSAHDLADGGLAQALVESCLRLDHGVEIRLPADPDPFVALFSESSGRVLTSVKPDAVDDFVALCDEVGVERHRLGTVGQPGAGAALVVTDQFSLPLPELREAWTGTLRNVFAA
jgi:phosphoribosylformylglycinamidine synthase subunit PurL